MYMHIICCAQCQCHKGQWSFVMKSFMQIYRDSGLYLQIIYKIPLIKAWYLMHKHINRGTALVIKLNQNEC